MVQHREFGGDYLDVVAKVVFADPYGLWKLGYSTNYPE
jgi:hypothetical protein